MVFRLDQREPACNRRTRPSKWICPCEVENHNAGFEFERSKGSRVIGNSQRLGGDIGISRDFRVDRNDIVLAFQLQPVTADVDERDRVRPRICVLLQKVAESAAQRVLVKVARTSNIKASCLESLCDQARIVCRRRKRSDLVASIATSRLRNHVPWGTELATSSPYRCAGFITASCMPRRHPTTAQGRARVVAHAPIPENAAPSTPIGSATNG
jgi:hypothetical protein